MNVIVANKQQNLLMNSLDIDIIKSLNGEYESSEIVDMFKSFFYSRMILDVTALKNNESVDSYSTLIKGLDVNKIIFLLPQGSKLCTPSFLSKLIDIGIYNFTRELTGITYLMENPNSYRDVAQYHDLANTNLGPSLAPKSGSDNNTSIPTNEPSPTPEPEMQMGAQQMPMNAPGPQPQMMQQPINPFGAVQQMPMEQPNPQAMMMGNMNMNVIDAGIPVISMHAPCETVSKVDVYEAYKGYIEFIKNIA